MKKMILVVTLCVLMSAPAMLFAYSGSANVTAGSNVKYGDVVSLYATFDVDGSGSGLTNPSFEIDCYANWTTPCGNEYFSYNPGAIFQSSISYDKYVKETFDCGDAGTYRIFASAEIIVYENIGGNRYVVVDEGDTDDAEEILP